MHQKNIFSFNTKWDYKTVLFFFFMLGLPNLLGIINIRTQWGFAIHFFQIAIFIAAAIYGPIGGMLSGTVGSVYSAYTMNNPYIIVGNAILGLFTGLFLRYGLNMIIAVLLAFIIQIPWLVITDYYFVHLPVSMIKGVVIALLISNSIWALAVSLVLNHIKKPLGLR